MFRVTRYPMISKTESGRVGYRKKYRVAGRVRVPAGHWLQLKKKTLFKPNAGWTVQNILENQRRDKTLGRKKRASRYGAFIAYVF